MKWIRACAVKIGWREKFRFSSQYKSILLTAKEKFNRITNVQLSIFPRHDFARLEFRRRGIRPYARILKAHSHSMSGSSIWASLVCHCYFWIAGGRLQYLTRWLLTLQLFRNSIDTQEKLRLNLHSLSVCVWAFGIRAVMFELLLQDPDTSQFFLFLFYNSSIPQILSTTTISGFLA
jgi:hypothetical protein